MILIDTSAWIEFLRGTGSDIDRRVGTVLATGEFAITDPIVAELLAGARDEADTRRLHGIIDSAHFVPVRPLLDYEAAADLVRRCRVAGTTPRSLADCLIAAVAIEKGLPVLAADRSLDAIGRVSALQMA